MAGKEFYNQLSLNEEINRDHLWEPYLKSRKAFRITLRASEMSGTQQQKPVSLSLILGTQVKVEGKS